ncbi:hypothetical protein [Halomontanus rarus]|uniref:hypothetical protein n=1 Tax=Halomontanus rarus TaxID=3034020 RepID=UPI0023E77246|nr:hypothetical protein [Halovivax sp. TS33]
MNSHNWTRRTVIGGIATGLITAVSGCTGSSDGVFEDVFVEETALVLEFTSESPVEKVNVIRPDGELFAERELPAGSSRETIEIGTDYQPGEYEILGLEDGEERARESIVIEPDVQITDLRLGRNHPEAMYEDASDRVAQREAIVTLENTGTGPDAATRLEFSGDVPRPTPDDYKESGIHDTDSDIRRHADTITLTPGSEIVIYSRSMPFSSAGDEISCSPESTEGEFETIVETSVQDEDTVATFNVTYTGEDLLECEIELEVKS